MEKDGLDKTGVSRGPGMIPTREFDAGMHITPMPFMSLRIGYLKYELDYDDAAVAGGAGSTTSGFYLGGGFHW